MGFWKRRLQEFDELGLSTAFHAHSDRAVGACCIADKALALYLSRLGAIEKCDFCGSAPAQGATAENLFGYMIGCLLAEWDDPVNEVGWDSAEGGWVGATVIDTGDLLDAVGEPFLHADLRDLFVSSIEHDWCQRNPYGLAPHQRLHLSWEYFAHYVRHEHRYLFLRTGRVSDDPELVKPAEMLDELAIAIHNVGHHLIRRFPSGSQLVRAREHGKNERPSDARDLGSPPRNRTRTTRMSPAGVSMFYSAEDRETALAELRPSADTLATTACWYTTKDIAFLDLAQLPRVPSIFDMTARYQRTWIAFLRQFADEISRPATEASEVDYVPSQIVTEYVRDVLSADHGEPLLGIRYRSSVEPDGICWVLFVGPEGCDNNSDSELEAVVRLDPPSIERHRPSWMRVDDEPQ